MFPLLPQKEEEEENEPEEGRLAKREAVVYDLHSQNRLTKIHNLKPR